MQVNDHFEELQSLYALDSDHPLYGQNIQLPLVHYKDPWDLTTAETRYLAPTLMRLALHREWHRPEVQDIQTLWTLPHGKELWKMIPDSFKISVLCQQRDRFAASEVKKLRDILDKKGYWFYCIPTVTLEIDHETGKQFMATSGEKVLTLLPKTPKMALKDGYPEETVEVLASQLLWVIRLRISQRLIQTLPDLYKELDGWVTYLAPELIEQTREQLLDRPDNPPTMLKGA